MQWDLSQLRSQKVHSIQQLAWNGSQVQGSFLGSNFQNNLISNFKMSVNSILIQITFLFVLSYFQIILDSNHLIFHVLQQFQSHNDYVGWIIPTGRSIALPPIQPQKDLSSYMHDIHYYIQTLPNVNILSTQMVDRSHTFSTYSESLD